MTDGSYDCPDCDSTEFEQRVEQQETVTVDENGEPEQIVADHVDVQVITCGDCGTVVEDYR